MVSEAEQIVLDLAKWRRNEAFGRMVPMRNVHYAPGNTANLGHRIEKEAARLRKELEAT